MMRWHEIPSLVIGMITFLLMWSDWLLTILQERERQSHYAEHYQSYPVNTIEGNPLLQTAVQRVQLFAVRHILIAIILSVVVAYVATLFEEGRALFLGYVWGIFLIVGNTHLGNLIGYKASRRGLHGKLYIHQRTGLWIQAGRYAAMTVFLLILAVCSTSSFIAGVTVAAATSTLRQFVWLRKVPPVSAEDQPPTANGQQETQELPLSYCPTMVAAERRGMVSLV